jgi:hypothetical protein
MKNQQDAHGGSHRLKGLAIAVALATAAYLLLVVSGRIPAANRLSAADCGLVVVAALVIAAAWKPDFFERLQKFDFAGVKFELGEVKKGQIEVQKQQQEQQAVLDDVRLALRLLITEKEQDRLRNLLTHATDTYRVKGALRDEIRHLRAMKLVKMREGKTVGGMPEKAIFDLADYIELTEDGLRFISRFTNQLDVQGNEASTAN